MVYTDSTYPQSSTTALVTVQNLRYQCVAKKEKNFRHTEFLIKMEEAARNTVEKCSMSTRYQKETELDMKQFYNKVITDTDTESR